MRNQWLRLVLLRCRIPSGLHISRRYQVNPLWSLTSYLHENASRVTHNPFITCRYVSSSPELVVEPPKSPSNQTVAMLEIFAKPGRSTEGIKLDLDSNNVVITHDLVLSVLRSSETPSDVAKRLFSFVLGGESEKLSSKSYNCMLRILGGNGFVKESWDMIGIMKNKGYGVSKDTFDIISLKFKENGLHDDVEQLKAIYADGSASIRNNDSSNDNSVEKACSRICKIIRREVWTEGVEKKLQESGEEFSSELVKMVLKNLEFEQSKGLIFFRWIEESGLFKHDQKTYNAMARALSKEEFTDRFWRVVNDMRRSGNEMERETYVMSLQQFVKMKMIKDAVDLYEFAMTGANKLSVEDCTLLLKKIVVSRELDMDLFLKVVKIFKESGNVFTGSNLDSVVKSLISSGRLKECNKILKVMVDGDFAPTVSSQSYIGGMDGNNTSKAKLDYSAWVSLLKACCKARDLNEASDTFLKMVEQEGASRAGYPLELMVGLYCRENRPLDAYKLLLQMVDEKGLCPWHNTYKSLTSKLLAKKRFKAALHLLNIMKKQGYPPDLDSFVEYLSKNGNAEHTILFSQAMSSKRFPSTSVFLRLFQAFFKAGRNEEAQDFLSKCPRHIKNHADVLNLFCAMKS